MNGFFQNITIIGAGKVGATLGTMLHKKGYNFSSVISRNEKSAYNLADTLECENASSNIDDIPEETEMVLIATPAPAVEGVVDQLLQNKNVDFRDLFVVHTAGVLTSDALKPLMKKGSWTASVHPIMTFPQDQPVRSLRSQMKGIWYGVECHLKSKTRAEALVKDLDGVPLFLAKEMKPIYHVLCVFASGHLVANLHAVSELMRVMRMKIHWTEIFTPLVNQSIKNALEFSPSRAVTGPVTRGDLQTIETHIAALKKHAPQYLPLYAASSIEAAKAVRENGKLSKEEHDKVVGHLKKFL